MNAYPQCNAALFAVSATSTPSNSSSTHSVSPHPRGTMPPSAAHLGLVPEPLPSSFLPSYYLDRQSPVLPSSLSHGADSGDAINGLNANYLSSPYPINIPTRHASRGLFDDISLPPPGRVAMPSYYSPVPTLDISLPEARSWEPQGRLPCHQQLFDWGRMPGEGGSLPPMDAGGGQRPANARAVSDSSPFSVPPPLVRSQASPVGEYDYPKSAVYPGNLYADLVGDVANWGTGRDVTGADAGQALAIYEHLFSSLPHLRPIPSGSSSNSPPSLQPLLDLSAEGLALFGQQYPPHEISQPTMPTPGPTRRVGKDKPQTKCLGCGATETPEWRRGPLGPRTLCNACGLVHMKMQRKKRKQDEKMAAAKAPADGFAADAPASGKAKKAKREGE